VDRIWPRGLSKEKARLSDWRKYLAPSNELRKWFAHDPERWEKFSERYHAELEEAGKVEVREISAMAEEVSVTLIFGAKDTEYDNARSLESFIRDL
jgi:uncharacterized protein YeaO (DUF488 family)